MTAASNIHANSSAGHAAVAARDLTLWALGDITGSYTAGRTIRSVTSFGGAFTGITGAAVGIDADFVAGLTSYNSALGYDSPNDYGWLLNMQSWGAIEGTIHALDGVGSVLAAGSMSAAITSPEIEQSLSNAVWVRDSYPGGLGSGVDHPLTQVFALLADTARGVAEALASQATAATAATAALPGILAQLATQAESLQGDPDHLAVTVAQVKAQLLQMVQSAHDSARQGYLQTRGDYHENRMQLYAAATANAQQLLQDLLAYHTQNEGNTLALNALMQARTAAGNWTALIKGEEFQKTQSDAETAASTRSITWAEAVREKIEAEKEAQQQQQQQSDVLTHMILGLLSAYDPTGIVSAVNGAVYMVEGDYADAALAFVGAIPGLGEVFNFTRELQQLEKVGVSLCQVQRWGDVAINLWRAGKDAANGNWAMAGLDLGFGIIGFLTGGCFAAGTQVVIGIDPVNGSYITKNIEDLKVGDQVLSKSESDPDGPLEYQTVTQTYTQVVNTIRAITVRDADGKTEVIQASDQHPFYVQGVQANNGFVEAGELQTGMTLVDANGAAETIIGISDEEAPAGTMVYNLELSGDHTYFVMDQNGDAVWVHNAALSCLPKAKFGSRVHGAYRDLIQKEGYLIRALPSGAIPDAWKIIKNQSGTIKEIIVRELKPDGGLATLLSRTEKKGISQAEGYLSELIDINKKQITSKTIFSIFTDTYYR